MKRAFVITLGWLIASTGLYLAVLGLELYWNLYDWQPRVDWKAIGLVIVMLGILLAIRMLARASRDRFSRSVALVECLVLLSLAIYVFPAEPLTQGLFARTTASPFWYRAARLSVMGLPTILWALGSRCQIVRERSS